MSKILIRDESKFINNSGFEKLRSIDIELFGGTFGGVTLTRVEDWLLGFRSVSNHEMMVYTTTETAQTYSHGNVSLKGYCLHVNPKFAQLVYHNGKSCIDCEDNCSNVITSYKYRILTNNKQFRALLDQEKGSFAKALIKYSESRFKTMGFSSTHINAINNKLNSRNPKSGKTVKIFDFYRSLISGRVEELIDCFDDKCHLCYLFNRYDLLQVITDKGSYFTTERDDHFENYTDSRLCKATDIDQRTMNEEGDNYNETNEPLRLPATVCWITDHKICYDDLISIACSVPDSAVHMGANYEHPHFLKYDLSNVYVLRIDSMDGVERFVVNSLESDLLILYLHKIKNILNKVYFQNDITDPNICVIPFVFSETVYSKVGPLTFVIKWLCDFFTTKQVRASKIFSYFRQKELGAAASFKQYFSFSVILSSCMQYYALNPFISDGRSMHDMTTEASYQIGTQMKEMAFLKSNQHINTLSYYMERLTQTRQRTGERIYLSIVGNLSGRGLSYSDKFIAKVVGMLLESVMEGTLLEADIIGDPSSYIIMASDVLFTSSGL